ncbi:MAG TPA: Rieske 2Fe-2S domain-containing protein [Thermoanaerobaculia bacterium]|nr:Rieske 2Fe-2S domain-containing protein [Thermoanaerobaculia bacterium]
MVCRSSALRRGAIRRFELGGERVVLFRGSDNGVVRALPAHCEHQGVDLAHGTVVGDRLRCPLHHWEYSDRCERIPGLAAAPRSFARYAATERFGMIFLHLGAEPASDIPGFSVDDRQLSFHAGKPVQIECPWYAPVANAFDMIHLRTVHQRELTSDVECSRPDPMTFLVRYTTAVIGNGWSDHAMRALSGNDIRVRITCTGGALLMVESQIRRWRSYLLVCLRPTAAGVSILPLFGVPRTKTGLHALHVRVSAALFTAFLSRDLQALDGIRFPERFGHGPDAVLNTCYDYLCGLPEYEECA